MVYTVVVVGSRCPTTADGEGGGGGAREARALFFCGASVLYHFPAADVVAARNMLESPVETKIAAVAAAPPPSLSVTTWKRQAMMIRMEESRCSRRNNTRGPFVVHTYSYTYVGRYVRNGDIICTTGRCSQVGSLASLVAAAPSYLQKHIHACTPESMHGLICANAMTNCPVSECACTSRPVGVTQSVHSAHSNRDFLAERRGGNIQKVDR